MVAETTPTVAVTMALLSRREGLCGLPCGKGVLWTKKEGDLHSSQINVYKHTCVRPCLHLYTTASLMPPDYLHLILNRSAQQSTEDMCR